MFGCLIDCMFDCGLGREKMGKMVACTWGCSSVVERLVRNQKVASSSLVSSTILMVQNLAGTLGLTDRLLTVASKSCQVASVLQP